MYYCYLVFGYGSTKGGSISFMLTVMYAISTLVSQVLYAIFAKNLLENKYIVSLVYLLSLAICYSFYWFPNFGFILAVNMPWLIYIGALLLFFDKVWYRLLLSCKCNPQLNITNCTLAKEKKPSSLPCAH